jgi:hypothetical protein
VLDRGTSLDALVNNESECAKAGEPIEHLPE